MDPVLKVLLLGTRCPESPLYALRGGLSKTVLPLIWRLIQKSYENSIISSGGTFFEESGYAVQFPEPKGRNVNMMPFILGDKGSIPEDLREYHDVIECMGIPRDEFFTVCYLTIHESVVKAGTSQRRPGLHCETPDVFFGEKGDVPFTRKIWVERGGWGGGYFDETRHGGIYMMSNVSNTCAVWNCAVKVPGRAYNLRDYEYDEYDGVDVMLKEVIYTEDDCYRNIIGTLGSLEHLRGTLKSVVGDPFIMSENVAYWMTDLTPHESLPVAEDTPRQYIRVVTSQLGGWYREHSTENPLGIMPDCPIIEGNKFEKNE